MNYTTELDAVNTMLSAVGSSPVSDLNNPGAEVAIAKNILTETRREILSRGWAFNSDQKMEVAVPTSGEYVIAENIMRIDGSDGYNGNLDLVQRSGKLYDRKNHTFALTETTITVDVIYSLNWTDCPEVARRLMMIRSARIFADRIVGYNHQHQFTMGDEFQAMSDLREYEGDTGDYNMLTGNWDVYRIIRRGSPIRDVSF
tara:strand:- start:1282 stop:1884 length:603 start_codon:yes stop_codon:yes gene_type:complete